MELDPVPYECVEKMKYTAAFSWPIERQLIVSGQMHSKIVAIAPPSGNSFIVAFPKDSEK